MIEVERKSNAILLNNMDNVAVALENLKPGDRLSVAGIAKDVVLAEHVPYGHKVALLPIAANQKILKYGECMGIATTDIEPGTHVHVSNVRGLNDEDKTEVVLTGGDNFENV